MAVTGFATLAWYDVSAPENVPMSMPLRRSAASVASWEIELIVTVAEPIGDPPRAAVTVTVSASSSSWSSAAASAAVTEDAPAASVSVSGTPV